MKSFYLILFTIVFVLVFPIITYADELTLTKIGALEVNGKYYNHWWYEPTRLTLEGTGSKGANIDITVDGIVKTIKASSEDGLWKYTHEGELEKTDHQITVGSGNKQISFILTIGTGSVPAEQTQTKDNLLQAGNLLPFFLLLTISGSLIYYGFKRT